MIVFIDIGDQGNCLRKVYMDGLVGRYVLIIRIWDHDRAVFHTCGTTRALVLYDVSGLFCQVYLKVTCFPFDTVNLGKRQDLYIGMPADLDQFGRQNSHRAVIGGIGLVELRHMTTNGR